MGLNGNGVVYLLLYDLWNELWCEDKAPSACQTLVH